MTSWDVRTDNNRFTALGRCWRAYLYVCPFVCSWSLTLYKYKRRTVGRQNRLHLAVKNLRFGSPRFWQKNTVFGFGSVTVTALICIIFKAVCVVNFWIF